MKLEKKVKKAYFSSVVSVALIPCIKDYREAGICSEVWLGRLELSKIKFEAMSSFEKFLQEKKMHRSKSSFVKFVSE